MSSHPHPYPQAAWLRDLVPDADGDGWSWQGVPYRRGDPRPLGGPLAGLVGPRLSLADLEDREPDGNDEWMPAVRAWRVLFLEGNSFVAPTQDGLSAALAELVAGWAPGVAWAVGVSPLPVQKYGIVHTCLAAPPDETTGQPLALELYGEVFHDPNSMEAHHGHAATRMRRGETFDEQFPPLEGPIRVTLRTAIVANCLYLGVGMPFYM